MESGEGIERLDRLKRYQNDFAQVESGEGIERCCTSSNRRRGLPRWWNPVKELKARRTASRRSACPRMWNPVKELKEIPVGSDSSIVIALKWNPVKELKGHEFPPIKLSGLRGVESGEGIERHSGQSLNHISHIEWNPVKELKASEVLAAASIAFRGIR